jgi:hypothetical protein
MKTLLCSMVILFFVLHFFAVLICQGTTEYRVNIDMPDHELDDYYGTLPLALYSLFAAASQGIDWDSALRPLYRLDAFFPLAFIVYIIVTLYGVMNVVTSVFVDSAIMSSQHYKDLIILEKLHAREVAVKHMKEVFKQIDQEVFKQIDQDNSGTINANELEYFLTDPDLNEYVSALGISVEDSRMLFRLMDPEQVGRIDASEFCEGCLRLQGEAKSIDVHTMIFQVKLFLSKWSEFTTYVENRFDTIETTMGVSASKERPTCPVFNIEDTPEAKFQGWQHS